ncbi:ECF transporter S component [[Clostridium] fimetarium]|uniref:Riboflavin transporter FmnP n=1 Tax=[Clostridium] fimetarium TaxID=99656 RepID=A0A1I0R8V8_9FIRM|nr:ECF transporter S component [[Clostridium] fimetarium]SEW37189.1 Riboflavin transporter FmnP [[Clostridium] fimetarium]
MMNLGKLFEQVKDNVIFILISIIIMVAVYAIAKLSEKLIEKKTGVKFNQAKTRINRMTVIAMLSALAFILMFFEFPIPFVPDFYKIDASEIPVLIGAFMFGPAAGVVIEGVKVLLHLVIKGTTTVFVGDFANFILGCFYVVPAATIYLFKKTKKSAIIGMIVGTAVLVIAGCLLNAFYLLPKYAELYGIPMEYLIAAGTAVNSNITNVFSFVALAVAPFNILKGTLVAIATGVLYKYVSKIIKN